jgi:hypothetical protein
MTRKKKPTNCPNVRQLKNGEITVLYTYCGILFSHKNDVTHATTLVNLENIMLI